MGKHTNKGWGCGLCLEYQHLGIWGRKIINSRPSWATQQDPVWKTKSRIIWAVPKALQKPWLLSFLYLFLCCLYRKWIFLNKILNLKFIFSYQLKNLMCSLNIFISPHSLAKLESKVETINNELGGADSSELGQAGRLQSLRFWVQAFEQSLLSPYGSTCWLVCSLRDGDVRSRGLVRQGPRLHSLDLDTTT